MDRQSEFFVEAATPTLGTEPARFERAVTMGDVQLDFLDGTPAIELKLLAKKLLFYSLTTLVFYGAFTAVAFIGVPVETVYEPLGSSRKAEERVETYNTYSGYVMAFIETLLGMYMSSFLPVLDVYVYNALYFLQRATTTRDTTTGKVTAAVKVSRSTHTAILFLFPIVLALTMGNSLRGLQANQSSDGFKHIMSADDLKKEQPTLELLKVKKGNATTLAGAPKGRSVQDTILRNAIRAQSTPFMFSTKSPCGGIDNDTDEDPISAADKTQRTVQLNVHELDATSAVYGFVPQEWNGEALAIALEPKSSFHTTYKDVLAAQKAGATLPLPADFSITTAFEILVQGKLVVEKARGDAATDTYLCSLTDGRVQLDAVEVPVDATEEEEEAANSTTTTSKKAAPHVKITKGLHVPKPVLKHFATGMKRRRRRLQDQSGSSASTDEAEVGSDADALEEDDEGEEEVDLDDGRNGWTYENGTRQCQGAVSSLFDMFDFDVREYHTPENLVIGAAAIFNKTLSSISIEDTEITLEKYELTKQIQIETLRIDLLIDPSVSYGLNEGCSATESSAGANASANATSSSCDSTYYYDFLGESFCGSDGCAFLDNSGTMEMQREIGLVPYVVNCTLDADHVFYSADFRGFFPTDCVKVANTALLYGIGSYMTGDEYGSNDTVHETYAPYITKPRRHLRLTFAKVTWQTEDLATKFNAKCGTDSNGNKADCNGLWYQLQSSGRFLFAGGDALPTKKLANADFRSPISLVQLNAPTLFVPKLEQKVTLEPLTPGNFKRVKWDKKPTTIKAKNGSTIAGAAVALQGSECSMIVDSYLRQLSDNYYVVEQPLQVMYTSFFYYLMQNAAVTELNDTSLALSNSTTTTELNLNGSIIVVSRSSADSDDRFGNVKLKGDMQVRSIRVSIPTSSFHTTLAGCALIFVLMVLVICVPARRVEHFDEGASMAQEFVAMRSDEAYPDSVHKKTLLFPATSEVVAFDELEVERMVLAHETERERKVFM